MILAAFNAHMLANMEPWGQSQDWGSLPGLRHTPGAISKHMLFNQHTYILLPVQPLQAHAAAQQRCLILLHFSNLIPASCNADCELCSRHHGSNLYLSGDSIVVTLCSYSAPPAQLCKLLYKLRT